MPVKWQSSRFPGVRFYEHPMRKHGVKADRYYSIRFQMSGMRREEGLGWASQGWSEKEAADELSRLRQAARKGEGPTTLAEKRELAEVDRKNREENKLKDERESLTFATVFSEHYLPYTSLTKSKKSVDAEKGVYKNWIAPVIAVLPLRDIASIHVERIRKTMRDKGRAPRTVHRAVQIISQVYNFCRRNDLYMGESPATKVGRPSKVDNKRQKFLTYDEASDLLKELASRSEDLHDQALLSLQCGLRAGEVFGLTWADIDFERELIMLRDTKTGPTRHVPMTSQVKSMLLNRERGEPSGLVFLSRNGAKHVQISKSFNRAVDKLKLNAGVTDPRLKVVFHTLRHTFASWLVMAGTPLYTVGKLLGHSTMSMTERYSHLAPDHMKNAVRALEEAIEKNQN